MHLSFSQKINYDKSEKFGKGKTLSKMNTSDTLPLPRTKKEAMQMRENIIERILALSDEQIQDLLTLIQQSEEASQVSEVLRQTSA